MNRVIFVLLALMLLVGCDSDKNGSIITVSPEAPTAIIRLEGFRMWRVVDTEAGIVCYIGNNGVDCLPISETNLRVGE